VAQRDCHMKNSEASRHANHTLHAGYLDIPGFCSPPRPFEVRKLFILQALVRRRKVATPCLYYNHNYLNYI